MFAKEEYLQSFWKSGVPMDKHRAFKSSVKSVNWKKQVRKFAFVKWLAAKVRLCFFKNTIQLRLSEKYKTKIYFISSGT